jgi:hypothetical protein
MAMQRTFFGRTFFGRAVFKRTKSIAGAVLLGLGVIILHGNLDRTATQLSHFCFMIPGQALGALFTVIVAASRLVRAYAPAAAHGRQFLQDFLQQIVAIAWPLVLVVVGAVLSWDDVMHKFEAFPQEKIVDASMGPPVVQIKVEVDPPGVRGGRLWP